MKKNINIISIALIATVLFAILFQSVHSFEHFKIELSQKKCHHKYNSSKEITHQHHHLYDCYVCNLTLGNYTVSQIFTFHFYFSKVNIPYYFSFFETINYYSGSNFSLRGPPQFIA